MAQISIEYKGWLIVVAIGLSLVAIGAIADFLVKKDEIKWLHAKFLKLSEALTKIPLREWQVKIAEAGIEIIEKISIYTGFYLFPLSYNDFFENILLSKCRFKFRQYFGRVPIFEIFLFGILIILFGIFLIYIIMPGNWFLAFLVLFCIGILFSTLSIAFMNFHSGMILFLFSGPIAISSVLSVVAYIITRYIISSFPLNSYWYEIANTRIIPIKPLLLYCVNFPFDFATIAVSILLLRFVIKHKCFIGIVAAVDIIISAFLTVMLYCFLLVIENEWNILHFHVYFAESLHWFKDVIVGIYQAAKYNEPFAKHLAGLRDIHLLPILLTTFVPVALYMLVFLFISFCKPVLKLASRIFGAVGEKEESVFKQFGFLIAAIMAAVKAIYEVLTL